MSEFKKLDKKVRKMDLHDVQLTKLSTVAAVLFLLAIWPALLDVVLGVHWGWYLGAMIIFAIRPVRKVFF